MSPDIIIVGGGVAAMGAALYSLRGSRKVLLIERQAIGGQIADSPRVENYPTKKEISGLDLSSEMFEQITELGADFDMDEVLSISKEGDLFTVKCAYNEYKAPAVILATGCKHRKLNIPGEDAFLGKGISYCAVCDGDFYKGKKTVVIGDANSALQYAIFLSKSSSEVELITLFDGFFAEKSLVDTLDSIPNLRVRHNLNAVSFNGDDSLKSITFEDTKTKEKIDIQADGCFVAIGQIPDNDRFSDLLDLDKGFIVTDENMQTKTPGLFAAGDCRKKGWRQVVTAINDGAIASLSAQKYLSSLIASK